MAVNVRVNFYTMQDAQFPSDTKGDAAAFYVMQDVQLPLPATKLCVSWSSMQSVEYQLTLPKILTSLFLFQYIQVAPEESMVSNVYPELIGLSFSTGAKPTFSTDVQVHTSGRETRTQYWANPKWDFKLQYDYLPNKTTDSQTDYKKLVGFFLDRHGSFESFLFKAPDDRYVENLQLGIGDANTVEYDLYRQFGPYSEPIGQADPDNTTIWVEEPGEVYHVPNTGPYVVTLNHLQVASLTSVSQGATVLTQVTGTPGAGQYNWDPSTATLTFNAAQKNVNVSVHYKWVAQLSTDYTIRMPRTVVMNTAPHTGAIITTSFEFFFVVRFKDDEADFDQFMDRLWELGQIEMVSQPT